jgi:hypothetical protein
MNNVLIFRCMCSIPTKDKNSTSKGGGEDREVTVSGPHKVMGPGLLQFFKLNQSPARLTHIVLEDTRSGK